MLESILKIVAPGILQILPSFLPLEVTRIICTLDHLAYFKNYKMKVFILNKSCYVTPSSFGVFSDSWYLT